MTIDNNNEVEQLAKAIETLVRTAQNDSVISNQQQESHETINALIDSISTMFDNDNVGGRLSAIEKDLTGVMKHVERGDQHYQELLPSLKRELTSINSELAFFKKSTIVNTNATPGLKQELASIKRYFTSVEVKVADTNEQLPRFKHELTSINSKVARLKGGIANINDQLPSVKRELASTKSGVCALKDKITNINKHFPEFKREILSTKSEVINLKGKITNINDHLPSFKREVVSIQNNFATLNTQIATIKELLESQCGTSNQEQSNLTKDFPSLRQFEVMISGADIGSFKFYENGPERLILRTHQLDSSDLVRHILKRFSVGLGFILGREDYFGNREEFVDKLLRHLHRVMGKKPRLVKDDDFDTIYYS